MAKADLIARLSGDDKLSPVLQNVRKQLQDTGVASNKLDDIQKKFGKIADSSAPLNRKIRDIKKAMEEMAVAGLDATEEGQAMWKKLADEAKKYDETLKRIANDTKSMPAAPEAKGGGFDLKGSLSGLADQAGLGGATKALGGLAAMANPATIAVAAVGGTMIAAGKKAADFEVHLDALQALTGVTDDQMQAMSNTTLDMSKKFGINAGEIADSMGLIGSQAPELLKNTDALASVTDAAMTLSRAGSISAEAAGKAITTVTNQMGVSASEAMSIANTLEAAEQQGSASVEYLNTAIEKSGTQAKAAGMDYAQLIAMIESVAPKFSSADVAGSQLNSTLLKLSMGADEFNPAVVGMSTALDNLANAQLSNEQLSKMVGESNIVMVKSMIEARDSFNGFNESLRGTNAAVDAWQMKTDNMAGKIDKLKAVWDAFLITLGQSGLIQGIADNIMMVMEALGEVINVISEVIDAFDDFGGEGVEAINPLEVQLDFLVSVIRGVGEVLQVVVKIASKVFQEIKDACFNAANWMGEKWTELKNVLGDNAFARFVINAFNSIMEKVGKVINKIKEWWNNLKKSLGLEVSASANINTNVGGNAPAQSPTIENTMSGGTGGSVGTGGSGSRGKGKGKSTTPKTPKVEKVKIEPEEGSIKALQDKLSELNKELSETVVSDERLKEINAEKAALEEQIKQLQLRNGLIKETPKVEKVVNPLDEKRDKYNKANQSIGQVKADFKVGLISKEEAERAIADADAVIEGLGLQPLELHINDDGTIQSTEEQITTLQEKLQGMSGEIDGYVNQFTKLASVLGDENASAAEKGAAGLATIGTALNQIGADGPIAKIGAITAAIGQVVLGFATASAQAASLGPFGWLAFVGAGLGTVAAVITQLKGFADGGIVQGNSFHGDTMLARVNSGEMILNKQQQAALYHSLKSGGVGGGGMAGNVTFTIEGSKLKGCLNNYESKTKKIR